MAIFNSYFDITRGYVLYEVNGGTYTHTLYMVLKYVATRYLYPWPVR